MSKRIALFADGTWETPAKDTNVFKLKQAALWTVDQVVIYDDGVGADGNPISRILGGAFGTGLWGKVKQGYREIARVYKPGDQIYLFGFSRGAYTARSLAGMIAVCGLPTKTFTDDMVEKVFAAYRDRDDRAAKLAELGEYGLFDAQITMVGVWDTVGALGIPSAIGLSDPIVYGFLDTNLHPDVQNAYHALAIDEKRIEFQATLWTNPPAPKQVVEQVWFSGTHGDVGGGSTPDSDGTALSDLALGWMMGKANALGLKFDAAMLKKYALPLDPKFALDTLHGSWSILWGFFKHRHIDPKSVLANSVALRVAHDHSYRPSNLAVVNGELAHTYGLAPVVSQPAEAAAAANA